MKEYKTVPGPRGLRIEHGGDASGAIKDFATLINSECHDGWTYHSMETLTVYEKTGCFGGSVDIPHQYYMLVFEREI